MDNNSERREEWLRDVDGTGSMRPCWPDDPGAVEYVPADRLTNAEAEIERLQRAIRPFSAAVFNDNGDVTISTGHITQDDWLKLSAALKERDDVS